MRERHDPDLEDQAERIDREEDDAAAEGDIAAGAATAGQAGQAAGVGAAPLGGPALPQSEEEDDAEDPRLR